MKSILPIVCAAVTLGIGPGASVAPADAVAGRSERRAIFLAEDADKVAGEIQVAPGQSKILRSKSDVLRTSVADESVCEVKVSTPRELSIAGRKQGQTTVTFWLKDDQYQPVTISVRVAPRK